MSVDVATPQLPPTSDKVNWPRERDKLWLKLMPTMLKWLKIEPFTYQKEFLFPDPEVYDFFQLQMIQLGGAKRIGKSLMLGASALPYCLMSGATIRLYAPEHENAQREFAHIDNFLFGPGGLAEKIPQLKEHMTKYQPDPSVGRLELAWSWGANIRSMSWERRKQWVGEPVDLAIICEPGLFDSISIYTRYIKPNLQDRNGLCRSAGTVDNPWMFDVHEMSHNAEEHPDIACVCEVPRWANESLLITKPKIELARREETLRDFSINWLGYWETYSNIAYEKWDQSQHVHRVSQKRWKRLKGIPAGWDHFLSLDTGRYCSCGEYVVNPQGVIIRIDEWTNYRYQAGQLVMSDERGFRPWFSDIINDLGGKRPLTYIDPSSQMKMDLQALGVPIVNAVNGHEVGVNTCNEYLGRKKFYLCLPDTRERTVLEFEIPKVKWHETETGVGGHSRLKRGDDHTADEFRYALASRPLAEPYFKKRTKTVMQRDVESMYRPAMDVDDVGMDGMGGEGGFY